MIIIYTFGKFVLEFVMIVALLSRLICQNQLLIKQSIFLI